MRGLGMFRWPYPEREDVAYIPDDSDLVIVQCYPGTYAEVLAPGRRHSGWLATSLLCDADARREWVALGAEPTDWRVMRWGDAHALGVEWPDCINGWPYPEQEDT